MDGIVVIIGTLIMLLILIIAIIAVRNKSKLDMDTIPKKIIHPVLIKTNMIDNDSLIRDSSGYQSIVIAENSILYGRRLGFINDEKFTLIWHMENDISLMDSDGLYWDLENFAYIYL